MDVELQDSGHVLGKVGNHSEVAVVVTDLQNFEQVSTLVNIFRNTLFTECWLALGSLKTLSLTCFIHVINVCVNRLFSRNPYLFFI